MSGRDGEGGKGLQHPGFWLKDTGTSGSKAAGQSPEAPCAREASGGRGPRAQGPGREEGPQIPFFWKDLFPRGENGSILFSVQLRKALGPPGRFQEPRGQPNARLGIKSTLGFYPSQNSSLPASSARRQPTTPSGDQGGLRVASVHCPSVHLKHPVPSCVTQAADPGRGQC